MFHGKKGAEKDYAGKSWLEPPKGLKPENEYCYLPKRWIHTWSGHTKASPSCLAFCTSCCAFTIVTLLSLSSCLEHMHRRKLWQLGGRLRGL